MLTLKNFEKEIDSTILKKGKQYYSSGNVVSIEETSDNVWSAEVEGSETYGVEITMKENDITYYSCNCPYGGTCKHVVATLFALREELKNTKKNPAKDKSVFEKLLQSITPADYQNFMRHYATKNKNFKTEFELFFADKDDRIDVEKKYSELIQKAIRKYADRGFIDYRSSFGLSSEIDKFLATGLGYVSKNNFKDAFALAKTVLKLMMQTMEYSDDSNGSLGDSIQSAIALLEKIIKAPGVAPSLKEEVFIFLEKELSDRTYFDYGDFGYSMFPLFKSLAIELGKVTVFLAFIDAQVAKLTGQYDNYRKEYFKKGKIEFFQQAGNVAEAEKLVLQNMDIVEVRMEVLNKKIQLKEYEAAKKIIHEGIQLAEEKSHPGTVSHWQKELLRIAVLEKDTIAIRYYTKYFAFDHGFSLDYYNQWKNTFAAPEWKATIDEHIDKTIEAVIKEWGKNKRWNSAHPPLLRNLAPIYIQEKQWDKLLALVQQENNLSTTLEYHPYLAKEYPSELLTIYLPALEEDGVRASNRGEYVELVQKMKKIMNDIPQGKEKVLFVATQLKERFSTKPRRPAMVEELGKIV
jgi:hypothetical protein